MEQTDLKLTVHYCVPIRASDLISINVLTDQKFIFEYSNKKSHYVVRKAVDNIFYNKLNKQMRIAGNGFTYLTTALSD